MKPIRVAIYSGAIPSTTFIERLIEALAQQGFTVLLFGSVKQKMRYTSPNIKVIGNRGGAVGFLETVIQFIALRLSAPDQYNTLRKHLGFGPFSGASSFRKWQVHLPVVLNLPDVFHVQWAKSVSDWIYLKEKFGVKVVLSLRGTHITISPVADENLARTYQQVFPGIDSFHCVSESILEEALQYGVKRDRVRIIYSGLDIIPMKAQRKPNQPLRLLSVGRFHWLKGYQYLLDSLVILKRLNVKFTFTLIAQGDLPEEILFQLHDLKLKEDVMWSKGLTHDEVMRQMTEHDVLILPSLSEGIANVVLEAMNVGLPVLSTDCGGMKEVIEDGINGFLVPVRNPEAIAEAIQKFNVLSPEEIEQIRRNAHLTVDQLFNREQSVKDFVTLYQEVVSCA